MVGDGGRYPTGCCCDSLNAKGNLVLATHRKYLKTVWAPRWIRRWCQVFCVNASPAFVISHEIASESCFALVYDFFGGLRSLSRSR
jgi:hypothetical protein